MTDADINDLIWERGVAASENPIRQRSGPSEEPCKGLVAGGGRNEDESQSAILIRPACSHLCLEIWKAN